MDPVEIPRAASPQRAPATIRRGLAPLRRALARIGSVFPRNAALDDVVTRASIAALPEEVWRRIIFYEEIPQRPRLLLRCCCRSRCARRNPACAWVRWWNAAMATAGLVKRITVVDPPTLVRFDVLEQHLGIEPCVTTVEGAYEIRRSVPARKWRSPRPIAGICARAGCGAGRSAGSRTPAPPHSPRHGRARISARAPPRAARRRCPTASSGRPRRDWIGVDPAGSPKLRGTTTAPGCAARRRRGTGARDRRRPRRRGCSTA